MYVKKLKNTAEKNKKINAILYKIFTLTKLDNILHITLSHKANIV